MESSEVRVRRATTADVGALAPLLARYQEFYDEPYDEVATAASLEARLAGGDYVVLLAEVGTRPVGFARCYPGLSSVLAAPGWSLNDLYVLESARRRGVAAALVEEAETAARQAGAVSLSLTTARGNDVAQRLYERRGYRVEDRHLHYAKPLS